MDITTIDVVEASPSEVTPLLPEKKPTCRSRRDTGAPRGLLLDNRTKERTGSNLQQKRLMMQKGLALRIKC
ncbi:hypothetical protein TNCT_484451 [Trichonephila clavata]|uniref:Uncharacterized protein n=1 Tax=Trichonephila clavata TaxID=2740835 RepID=A0A8X6FH56_TRICU|nr:hypothetical protein TNCT_484451 [Trichonephila clavata]